MASTISPMTQPFRERLRRPRAPRRLPRPSDALAAAAMALAAGGCSMGPLPVPPASIRTVSAIDTAKLPPLAVGNFTPDPAVQARDRSLSIRAGIVRPETGSFAGYLGETIKRQLAAAGKLDPASASVVAG